MNKKLLRKKLALMLATLKKKRKYYCEVEYLETTNQQTDSGSTNAAAYIDTGIIPNPNTKIECMVQFTTLISGDNKEALFGTTAGSGPSRFAFGFGAVSPYTNFYMGLGAQNLTTSVTRDTNVHKFIINAQNNSWEIDSSTGTFTSAGTISSTSSIYLFARNRTDYQYANKPANARVYYCKLWDNGVLVRDLIPVLDWDMTPCMYDRVTEQLFYSVGTGEFVAGREIHPVDYLESTGTQYIDMGVGVKSNTVFKATFSVASTATGRSYFGARNSSNERFQIVNSIGIGSGYYLVNGVYPVANQKYEIEMHANGDMYLDGVKRNASTGTFSQVSFERNLWLFATNYYDSSVGPGASTFWEAQVFEGDTLVHDFIPAIDENGVGYMFDRVSHTIYDNAGTGEFKYPAREVEYLESDGARAINAGVTVDNTCGYDVKWMALNSDDRVIIGTKGTGDSRWVLSGSNNPNVNLSWNNNYGSNGLGLNKIQTAQMNYLNDRKRILNDTPLADITTTLSSAASTYNVGIFAGPWGSSTFSLYSTCRIYYAKISKGTELIRDFVPMIKDGSPCLFDKVEGLYYFGGGTGTFTTGKIVEPEYE